METQLLTEKKTDVKAIRSRPLPTTPQRTAYQTTRLLPYDQKSVNVLQRYFKKLSHHTRFRNIIPQYLSVPDSKPFRIRHKTLYEILSTEETYVETLSK